ncbi:MAG: ImmA/IrrE family metallo-endopeptidase [Spirochaetota bacterium]|nr:ImmA/IrrE family metallo-endopeptidase [Spirochaetota bacterium]
MSNAMKAIVNPKMLKWARETSGKSIESIAQKMKKDIDCIEKWEIGDEKPTLRQAEKLAKYYKRPMAVFYLTKQPEESILPNNFRTLPYDVPHSFSSETLLVIRRAKRLQEIYIELLKETGKSISPIQIPRAKLTDSPELFANNLRRQEKLSVSNQKDWKDEYQALKEWRKWFEDKGILVFMLSMPMEEGRGFLLTDNLVPAIILNTKDSVHGRIFSLFHEYAHLMLQQEFNRYQNNLSDIELFCNSFAASFLVPEESLKSQMSDNYELDIQVFNLSKSFKVSQEVVLRRMLHVKLIDYQLFNQKLQSLSAKSSVTGGRISQPKKCIRDNGKPFVNLVLDAYRDQRITYSDVSDFLNVKLKHIGEIERLLYE